MPVVDEIFALKSLYEAIARIEHAKSYLVALLDECVANPELPRLENLFSWANKAVVASLELKIAQGEAAKSAEALRAELERRRK